MASVPLPGAPAVFRGVSCRWLTLAGSATFLAPVSWPTSAVETCWVGGVFGTPLGFLSCAVLFLRGLRFAQLPLPQLTLGGVFCLFCQRVPDLLLLWWRRLGGDSLYFCASPALANLQGFTGFCTLCQGAPVGVVSALWASVYCPCLLSLTLG